MRIRFSYGRQLNLVCLRRPFLSSCFPWSSRGLRPNLIGPCQFYRGAKKKSSTRLEELPQGRLEAESSFTPLDNDVPQYPTVIQGAKNNMLKFKNCVLLTRVGNFYEARCTRIEQLDNQTWWLILRSCILSKLKSLHPY